jgi:NADH-quinone oxidoreductase subunit L
MAGPTPVSALIHAATMVTAGIYMITRNAVLFELAPISSGAVALVGALTALFAATIAVGQFDIKRVLAYSTISQLGFMVAAVGIGAYAAGMFHLLAHAFFKALLFLSAGSVIQGVERGHHYSASHDEAFDPNDMRTMGGLRSAMPATFWVYLIGGLALAGIPPLAGFFSKDEILAEAAGLNPLVYWLLTAAAFLTAFYIGRQLLMVFGGRPRSAAAKSASENPPVMVVPLVLLAALAVLGGAINLPGLHPLTLFLEHTLEQLRPGEFSPLVAGISTGLALAGLGLAWTVYGRKTLRKGFQRDPLAAALGPVWTGIVNKWWVDDLYQAVFARGYVRLSAFLADTLDGRFWHDWFHDQVLARSFRTGARWLAEGFDLPIIDGATARLADLTRALATWLRGIETGYVRNYAISVFIGLVLMLSYLLIR